VHVFIAPKLLGGAEAGTAIAGRGIETIEKAVCLDSPVVEQLEGDVYLRARVRR
jgi:diaminohydroxyphosphoribosylaminopyrimidine deaminase/5-amino-6-(5-phosphoribosylamino)uracil reductase